MRLDFIWLNDCCGAGFSVCRNHGLSQLAGPRCDHQLSSQDAIKSFSADNMLIAEFGEERRNVVHIKEIPDIMKKPFWRSKMIGFMNMVASIIRESPAPWCII